MLMLYPFMILNVRTVACVLIALLFTGCSGGGGDSTGIVSSGGNASVHLSFAVPNSVAFAPVSGSSMLAFSDQADDPHTGSRVDRMMDILIPEAWAALTPVGIRSVRITIASNSTGVTTKTDVFNATAGQQVSRTYNIPVGNIYALRIRAYSGLLGAGTIVYQGTGIINLNNTAAGAAVPVAINMTPQINVPPVPTAPSIVTTVNQAASVLIAPNDPNTTDSHTFAITSQSVNGTAGVTNAGRVGYSPNANFIGTDSIVVTVTDQGGLTGIVTIPVTINASASTSPVVTVPNALSAPATVFDFAGRYLNDLVVDPNNGQRLYAATDSGVLRSIDGGSTWVLSFFNQTKINSITVAPGNANVLFASTNTLGVWRSVDAGVTWTNVLLSVPVSSVLINPNNVQNIYASGAKGVYISSDGGATWTVSNNGLINLNAGFLAHASNGDLYLPTRGGLFRSTDNGATWVLSSALGVVEVLDVVTQGTSVYAVTVSTAGTTRLFASSNGGAAWVERGATGFAGLRIIGMIATPAGLYVGTAANGLFASADGGLNWSIANSGLSDLHVVIGTFDPVTQTKGYLVDGKGVMYRTLNSAVTWAGISNSGAQRSDAVIQSFLNAATALDSVDGAISPSNNAPLIFPVGSTNVVFSAQNLAGNIGSASSTVTVPDGSAPYINTPSPVDIQIADTTGTGVAKTDATIAAWLAQVFAVDNLDGLVTVTNNAPATLPAGNNLATIFTATDASGNTSTGSGIIELIPAMQRTSTDSTGAQATGASVLSRLPSISADGQYVAFLSGAANLLGTGVDTNGLEDVFVKNRKTGSILRVSTDSAGVQATGGGSFAPSISADGRYIAFQSSSTNLVTGDTNGVSDIFVKDTQTGITTRVSTTSAGAQSVIGPGSYSPSISADGRYVAFASDMRDLVSGDTNFKTDIFVKDRQTGAIVRVSTDSAGTESTALSDLPSISADGRYIAFESSAPNLVAGDTNNAKDVFVKDTTTGTTVRVSTDSAGIQAAGISSAPRINADGRYVVFESGAANLLGTGIDTNGLIDVFVKDTQAGTTTRVSTDGAGNQATGGLSDGPSISADGRYVAFLSFATNLLGTGVDTNARGDVFVKDRQTGSIVRISTDSSGTQAIGGPSNGDYFIPAMSADGRFVAFEFNATNLVSGDTNGLWDVFLSFR